MTKVSMRENSTILSAAVRGEIDDWLRCFPADQKQSAILGALRAVQHEAGYLPVEQMDAVAEYLGMPSVSVYEVASFYSMYELAPVGRHTISVCTNLSCMLNGADEIIRYLKDKLNVDLGESTADGKFYLKCEEECLAACCGAPMMQIDHVYYEKLTVAKVNKILDQLS